MPRRVLSVIAVIIPMVLMEISFANVKVAHAVGGTSPSWTTTVSNINNPTNLQPFSSPAVGDLFGDGNNELVVGLSDGSLHAWYVSGPNAGTVVPGWPVSTGSQPVTASPTLADLFGTGQQEIIVPTFSGLVFVYYPNGQLVSGWPQASNPRGANLLRNFFASAAVGDLFGDGRLEIVTTGYDENLYAWLPSGQLLAGFPQWLYDTVWDTPTLANLHSVVSDTTSGLDIFVGADGSAGTTEPCGMQPNGNFGGSYWVFGPDGTLKWRKCVNQVPWASTVASNMDGGGFNLLLTGGGHFYGAPAGLNDNIYTYTGGQFRNMATDGQNMGSPAVGDIGLGGLSIVQNSESGNVYVWDSNGTLKSGWGTSGVFKPGSTCVNSLNPCYSVPLASPTIGPLPGGSNGVYVPDVNGDVWGLTGGGSIAFDGINAGTVFGSPTIAQIGPDVKLFTVGAVVVAGSYTSVTVNEYPICTGCSIPVNSWPTFHGNMQRTGTAFTTGHINALAATQASTAFTVSWATDAGQSAYVEDWNVYIKDTTAGTGWAHWITTPKTSAMFHGLANHSYKFAILQNKWGSFAADPAPVTTTINSAPTNPDPFTAMYAVDGYGHLQPASSQPLATTGLWPNWDIVRGFALRADNQGGYILDAFGGLHEFGNAPPLAPPGYWPNWDVSRRIAFVPGSNTKGYVIDAFGGFHAFGGAIMPVKYGYWPNWYIVKDFAVCRDGSGYTLDSYGGVSPFGTAPYESVSGYWPGWDIARGLAINSTCDGGYVIDGFGGLHPFGTEIGKNPAPTGYWPNWDVARAVTITPQGQPGAGCTGYTIDAFGGFHPWADNGCSNPPPVDTPGYTPGDIVHVGLEQ